MKLPRVFGKVGPGLIVAATGLGAGDIVAATVAGAQFGTTLLWAVVLGSVLKFCLNEGLARWQLATGKTMLEGWVDHLPRALSWYFMAYLLLWTFMVAAALMAATGLAAHAMIPSVSVATWGIIHSVLAFVLVLKGGYKMLETMMKCFIGMMFITIMACAIMVLPEAGEIVRGIMVPSLPDNSMIYVLGIIGGVGGSVTILSYGYWMREAGWNTPADIGLMRQDLGIAYSLTGIFGIAIILVAAGVEPDVVSGNNMALAVAEQLQTELGKPGKWVFLVGFWGAVFSSMMGVWHGVPYLFANLLYHLKGAGDIVDTGVNVTKTPVYRGYLLYLSLLPMVLLTLDRPVWIIVLYAVTGAFFMPLLAALLLFMNGQRRWLDEHSNGWVSKVLLLACLLLFGFLLFEQIQSRLV